VAARCWGPPNEKITVEVSNPLELIDALVSLCAALVQATLPDEDVARGVLRDVAARSAEWAELTRISKRVVDESENLP
jgi:precorrin-4 methylase